MSEQSITELPTYVVELQKRKLLIPSASVADIIPYEILQRIQDTPDWFLGVLGWRGVQVPVVTLEVLTVAGATFSLVSVSSACLVIVRSVTGSEEVPYFAVVAQTLPHLISLSAEVLCEIQGEPADAELARARLGEDIVAIPNIEYIEQAVQSVTG